MQAFGFSSAADLGKRLLQIMSINIRINPVDIHEPQRMKTQKKECWLLSTVPLVASGNFPPKKLSMIDIEFVDIPIDFERQSPIYFTFFWTDSQNWENRNYQVAVVG